MSKLARACELSLNDWYATFPDVIPEAECSKKHEKWKKNLFNKMRDDHYHRFTTKTIKVMLIAATLSALLLTAFVIPSSREFIIDNFDIFSRYKLTESNNNAVNGEITVGYIPEGFKLTNEMFFSRAIVNEYTDSIGGIFTITKSSSSIELDSNTEDVKTEIIVINNKTYHYCLGKNNIGNIIWNANDYVYQINGTLSKDELLKIAETVK